MKNTQYFIDTADTEAIKKILDYLNNEDALDNLAGITTNPNAMAKVNVHTLVDFEKRINEISAVLATVNYNKKTIYVQYPFSNPSVKQLEDWIEYLLSIGDGYTEIGLKIAPIKKQLELIDDYRYAIDFNVTGLADCSTALHSLSYYPSYVSVIPGRMEENGINAKEQMLYIESRSNVDGNKEFSKVIAGSMRTVDGLMSAIECNTVPTIGVKVFDLLYNRPAKSFLEMWNYSEPTTEFLTSPPVTEKMIDLSRQFFKQMDEMGSQLYVDLQQNLPKA